MNILIEEPRYRSILFGTFAIINITNTNDLVYLTELGKRLDNRTRKLMFGYRIRHVTRQFRTLDRCEKFTIEKDDCDSYINCRP